MNASQKYLVSVFSSALIGLVLAFLLVSTTKADTRPYFKVFDGDVFAGGAFENAPCLGANYQTGATSGAGRTNGGILAFATSNRAGASTNLGAFGLGLIEGGGTAPDTYGFFSGSSGYNRTDFANQAPSGYSNANYWGGFFEGSVSQNHCIPDYFSIASQAGATVNDLGTSATVALGSLSGKNRVTASGGSISTGGSVIQISNGRKIALFVTGNLYIDQNITYASGYNANNTPKLAVVVKGNIFIGPNVSRLDGWYIAQPNGANDGMIWTCHDSNVANPTDVFIKTSCGNKLTVNGALTANQINFLRTPGDVATAAVGEGKSSANVAEEFVFSPEMTVGGPFFVPERAKLKLESIVNLPPVF